MWHTKVALWACQLVGLSCNLDTVPNVETIQAAYQRESAEGSSLHDRNLRVLEAKCDDGKTGRFLCQVTFMSNGDPDERLYFDIVSVARVDQEWKLTSGLCKR